MKRMIGHKIKSYLVTYDQDMHFHLKAKSMKAAWKKVSKSWNKDVERGEVEDEKPNDVFSIQRLPKFK